MLHFMLIGVGIFILWAVMLIYSCHEEQKDETKEEVSRDYNNLIKKCK